MNYIVTLSPGAPENTYHDFASAVSTFSRFHKLFHNCWVIASEKETDEIISYLIDYIDRRNDHLVVSRIGNCRSFNTDIPDWVSN